MDRMTPPETCCTVCGATACSPKDLGSLNSFVTSVSGCAARILREVDDLKALDREVLDVVIGLGLGGREVRAVWPHTIDAVSGSV